MMLYNRATHQPWERLASSPTQSMPGAQYTAQFFDDSCLLDPRRRFMWDASFLELLRQNCELTCRGSRVDSTLGFLPDSRHLGPMFCRAPEKIVVMEHEKSRSQIDDDIALDHHQ